MARSPFVEVSQVVAELGESDQRVLVDVASRSLLESLVRGSTDLSWRRDLPLDWVPPHLMTDAATFVTLERAGRLLGCIGTMWPYQPLAVDVIEHTLAAAYRDPRFPGVTTDDVHALDLEISVLGDQVPCPARNRAELERLVRPGVDGVFVRTAEHRGTFLPAVWDDVPEPRAFFDALWHKAGLPPHTWPDDLEVSTYEVQKIVGRGPR